ncbi:MAG: HD domain-containing protein [Nitrospiraceae bacterium]|nr:HD domain-containing protein [Nitrospiraceae bacterium]
MVVLFLLGITTLSFLVFTLQSVEHDFTGEAVAMAETMGRSAAASAAYSLLSGDMLGLDSVVSRMKASHINIDSVAILDNSMKAVAHSDLNKRGETILPGPGRLLSIDRYGSVTERSNGRLQVLAPVSVFGRRMGYALLEVDGALLRRARQSAEKSVFKGLAVAAVLGILGVFLLTTSVTGPIKELSAGVLELKAGRKKRLKVYSRDELGQLTRNFNEMSALIIEQKDRLAGYAGELEESYVSTLRVLAAAIDARDPYTLGHSARVAQLSLKIGHALCLPEKELEDLEVACLFHDVGKIKTPDYVLLKPGRLSDVEFREMARHTEDGTNILEKAPSLVKYIPAVRHHHEWYNGKGYPDGLSGDRIPRHAAIISIADSFDAMTSTRPYRNPRSEDEALEEIVRCSGTQFDPRFVEIFVKVFRNEHEGIMLSGLI